MCLVNGGLMYNLRIINSTLMRANNITELNINLLVFQNLKLLHNTKCCTILSHPKMIYSVQDMIMEYNAPKP